MRKVQLAIVFFVVFFSLSSVVLAVEEPSSKEKVSVFVTWNAYMFGIEVENFKIHYRKADSTRTKIIVLKRGEYAWDFPEYQIENLTPGTEYCASLSVATATKEKFVRENVCFTTPKDNLTQLDAVVLSWNPFE